MNSNVNASTYRPDIDGLRAVAVLIVLGFHAFPEYIPGGFVGVDVFFAISGYLITGIIIREVDAGSFSFTQFYARRVRRIFPALIIVLSSSLVCGWFVLLVREYEALGEHVAAGAAFVANLVLWSEAGYFDLSASLKPLLHLWSLAIEEQFYLAWPLALYVLPSRSSIRFISIFLVALASLYFSWTIVTTSPVEDFYSPLTRAWELMAGALLALVSRIPAPSRRALPERLRVVIRNVLTALGAVMIVVAVAFLDEHKSYPGRLALVPVLGALLIISARGATLNRLLSTAPFVAVGLISYPLYLWHWPLLVFARLLSGADVLDPVLRVACLALAFMLATATYVLVERPIRSRGLRAVPFLIVTMVGVGSFGWLAYLAGGQILGKPLDLVTATFKGYDHWPEHDDVCDRNFPQFATYDRCRISIDDAPDLVVIGDSHSAQYFNSLASAFPDRVVMNIDEQACLPFPAFVGEQCKVHLEETYSFLLDTPSVRTVILSGYWNHLMVGGMKKELLGGGELMPFEQAAADKFVALGRTLMERLLHAGKKVVFLIDNPDLPFNPRACIERPVSILQIVQRPCAISREEFDRRSRVFDGVTAKLLAGWDSERFTVVNARSALCGDIWCNVMDGPLPLYWDRHHLTQRGADRVVDLMRSELTR